jgi:hypothetical protein
MTTNDPRSPFWNAAIELNDAVAQYYAALQGSFSRPTEEPGRSEQWLRECAHNLDQRVLSMQRFIDHVVKSLLSEGSSLQLHQQPFLNVADRNSPSFCLNGVCFGALE